MAVTAACRLFQLRLIIMHAGATATIWAYNRTHSYICLVMAGDTLYSYTICLSIVVILCSRVSNNIKLINKYRSINGLSSLHIHVTVSVSIISISAK